MTINTYPELSHAEWARFSSSDTPQLAFEYAVDLLRARGWSPPTAHKYPVGTRVIKRGGDYTFEGVVTCTFAKCSGALRYTVEDYRGCVHIFNEGQLERA